VSEVRVGVIGYGLAGRLFHAPFIASTPGMALTHVVTRDPGRAAAAVADHPGVLVLSSSDELLETDVDVVVVASPSRFHAEHARQALAGGRHVVVDKPVAGNADEFAALLEFASARHRRLTVFHNRRWDSDFRTLRQIVESGQLGRVHRFETRMDRWRPRGKGGWRESTDPRDLGGLRYDLGPHLVDQALLLFGPVDSVHARAVSLRAVGSLDDDVVATLQHTSGTATMISASLLTAIPGPRFRVCGLDGAALLQHADSQEDHLRAGDRPDGPGWGAEPGLCAEVVLGEDATRHEVPYLDGQWPHFYACVRDGVNDDGPMPVTPESALATMRVIDAIGEAALTGQIATPR
jgi:predicted dehydrogenase